MIIATFVAALALVFAPQDKPLTCPVMTGNEVQADSPKIEYNGALFAFCCPGCDTRFEKNPTRILADAGKAGATVGTFLFDPVTGDRIDLDTAKFQADFNGVRFFFATEENLAKFNEDPKAFGTMPEKEMLSCPVRGVQIASYADSPGYTDYEGVRYYVCCPGCLRAMRAEPSKHAKPNDAAVTAPKAFAAPGARPAPKACGSGCAGGAAKAGAGTKPGGCCGGGCC